MSRCPMSLLSLSRKQQPQFRTPPSPRTSLSFFSFTTMGHQPSKDALTLYYNQDSSAAASYIAASHAGLKVNVVFVPLPTKPLADGTFIRTLPALRLADGTLLTQNASVLQAIAQAVPKSKLLPPADSKERLLVQDWLSWTASELHTPVVRPLFFNSPKEDDAAARAWLRSRLLAKFEELDGRLAGVSGFLVGSDFTVADAYLFVVLSWAPAYKVTHADYPNVAAYYNRIAALPSVKAAQAKMAAAGSEAAPATTA